MGTDRVDKLERQVAGLQRRMSSLEASVRQDANLLQIRETLDGISRCLTNANTAYDGSFHPDTVPGMDMDASRPYPRSAGLNSATRAQSAGANEGSHILQTRFRVL